MNTKTNDLEGSIPNPDAKPQFGKHRGAYEFPVSDEWKAWTGVDEKQMSQIDFATFLEDHILDVMTDPLVGTDSDSSLSAADIQLRDMRNLIGGSIASPQRIMELSRGLAIYEKGLVAGAINISSGEAAISFKTENVDEQGSPIKVPNLFLVGIPVFRFGARYRLIVRLRYRKNGGTITWMMSLHKPEEVFRAAVGETADRFKAETGAPLFFGKAEVRE